VRQQRAGARQPRAGASDGRSRPGLSELARGSGPAGIGVRGGAGRARRAALQADRRPGRLPAPLRRRRRPRRRRVRLVIRLAGGQDHTITVPAPLPIGDQRRTPAEVISAIDTLLNQHTSGHIADILNQQGLASGTGEPFHRLIIDHIIRAYRLRSRRQRLRDTGMLTLAETAAAHGVHNHTIKAWRRAGTVTSTRYNDKGEFLYHPPDPDNPPDRPKIGRRPKHP